MNSDLRIEAHEAALSVTLEAANLPTTFSMRRAADAGFKLALAGSQPAPAHGELLDRIKRRLECCGIEPCVNGATSFSCEACRVFRDCLTALTAPPSAVDVEAWRCQHARRVIDRNSVSGLSWQDKYLAIIAALDGTDDHLAASAEPAPLSAVDCTCSLSAIDYDFGHHRSCPIHGDRPMAPPSSVDVEALVVAVLDGLHRVEAPVTHCRALAAGEDAIRTYFARLAASAEKGSE